MNYLNVNNKYYKHKNGEIYVRTDKKSSYFIKLNDLIEYGFSCYSRRMNEEDFEKISYEEVLTIFLEKS